MNPVRGCSRQVPFPLAGQFCQICPQGFIDKEAAEPVALAGSSPFDTLSAELVDPLLHKRLNISARLKPPSDLFSSHQTRAMVRQYVLHIKNYPPPFESLWP